MGHIRSYVASSMALLLALHSPLRSADSTTSGSPESQTVGQAAENARRAAANNRLRNTALALGVIAFGIIAVIAVGSNGNKNEGSCNTCGSCDS